jgi:glucose-6-phosphate dehydrogenase assembly protein OpcA
MEAAMSTASGPGVALDGELERLAVRDVGPALARRWVAIVAKYPRACSHTTSVDLVTYVDEPGAAPAVSWIIRELSAAHPIRAITTVDDDNAPEDTISAAIVRDAILGGDGSPSCSEEVYLYGSPVAAERMASAVFGLLEDDLPVYLWWRGPSPYGNPLFRLVAPFADKLIVDSMRFGDTAAALDAVRRMAEHRPGHVAIADLNWKRIRPWRQTIAACFDDLQTAALLELFDRCEISFASSRSAATPLNARAVLLAGWIGSCVPRLRSKARISQTRSADDGAGRIESVCFTTSSSKAKLELRRVDQPLGIDGRVADASGGEFRRWTFPAKTLSESELLHMSLDDPARDPVFEAALTQG